MVYQNDGIDAMKTLLVRLAIIPIFLCLIVLFPSCYAETEDTPASAEDLSPEFIFDQAFEDFGIDFDAPVPVEQSTASALPGCSGPPPGIQNTKCWESLSILYCDFELPVIFQGVEYELHEAVIACDDETSPVWSDIVQCMPGGSGVRALFNFAGCLEDKGWPPEYPGVFDISEWDGLFLAFFGSNPGVPEVSQALNFWSFVDVVGGIPYPGHYYKTWQLTTGALLPPTGESMRAFFVGSTFSYAPPYPRTQQIIALYMYGWGDSVLFSNDHLVFQFYGYLDIFFSDQYDWSGYTGFRQGLYK
jgi:hypothetical protein